MLGACAIVAFLLGRELVVAGAGDCRAVLGTRHEEKLVAVSLSTDHKCNLPAEQARIEAAGGVGPSDTGPGGKGWAGVAGAGAPRAGPTRLRAVVGRVGSSGAVPEDRAAGARAGPAGKGCGCTIAGVPRP